MAPDERDLLAQIASGDVDAMKCFYALYRQRLWAYLWRQLDRDSGWAEEVTQDVFLAVWRSASGYRGDAQVSAWLFRIAHNAAANARRARSRRIAGQQLTSETDDDECGSPITLASPSLEDAVLDRLALAQALDRLSPKHREVLDLAFYQGFGSEEIAEILGIPVGTVKSRISYARRALQAHFAQATSVEEQHNDR